MYMYDSMHNSAVAAAAHMYGWSPLSDESTGKLITIVFLSLCLLYKYSLVKEHGLMKALARRVAFYFLILE